jgi:hypothetical protein
MVAGAERGIEVFRDQRYDVLQVVRDGDHLAVQLTWRATLSGDLRGLPAGTPLVAHVAAFSRVPRRADPRAELLRLLRADRGLTQTLIGREKEGLAERSPLDPGR